MPDNQLLKLKLDQLTPIRLVILRTIFLWSTQAVEMLFDDISAHVAEQSLFAISQRQNMVLFPCQYPTQDNPDNSHPIDQKKIQQFCNELNVLDLVHHERFVVRCEENTPLWTPLLHFIVQFRRFCLELIQQLGQFLLVIDSLIAVVKFTYPQLIKEEVESSATLRQIVLKWRCHNHCQQEILQAFGIANLLIFEGIPGYHASNMRLYSIFFFAIFGPLVHQPRDILVNIFYKLLLVYTQLFKTDLKLLIVALTIGILSVFTFRCLMILLVDLFFSGFWLVLYDSLPDCPSRFRKSVKCDQGVDFNQLDRRCARNTMGYFVSKFCPLLSTLKYFFQLFCGDNLIEIIEFDADSRHKYQVSLENFLLLVDEDLKAV